MSEVWIHGNDWSDENIHDDSGVRVVWYEDYQALAAVRDRYLAALERIELMDPDWTLGVDENMSRLQSIAGRALKGGGDEAV